MPYQQSPTASILPLANSFGGNGRPWNSRNHRGRRGKSRIMEQIDYFLEGMGLYRKQTARDGTCLFRCVSEQLFYSQCFHYSVRLSCIHFMERNRSLFPDKIGGERFEEHARRLRSPREWAGHWEMQAMSLLYKRDFIVFTDMNTTPVQLTDNNFPDKILLCQIGHNHFDSVFPKSFIDNAAICQGLIYELLYGQVFGMEDIDTAIQVMLYEGKPAKESSEATLMLKENNRPNSVVNVLVKGGTPFPYKVAKSLDPRMYRNVEFDLWSDEKKEMKRSNGVFHNEILQIGSKCLVTIDDERQYPAYIQDMQPDKGPVNVFVEVLGQRCTVPYDRIEPIVLPLAMSKTRCVCINGSTTAAAATATAATTAVQQALRFRTRCRTITSSNRFGSSATEKSIRDVVVSASVDKFHRRTTTTTSAAASTNNKLALSPMDLNNNQLENQVVVWRNSHNHSAASASMSLGTPDSTGSSVESHSLSIESTTTTSGGLAIASDSSPLTIEQLLTASQQQPQQQQQPYYLMTPPSQWIPPVCPPPPSPQTYPGAQTGYLGPHPTPVYVTFSDGTTMIIPGHRMNDPQQPGPWMFYDPVAPMAAPPPFGPPHYPIMNDVEQLDNQQHGQRSQAQNVQRVVFHDQVTERSTFGDMTTQNSSVSLMQLQSMGYWTDPGPYPQANQHLAYTNNHPPMVSGDFTPVTLYFSPPYPQPAFHQVST